MSAINYLKSLLPSFEGAKLSDALASSKNEIVEHLLPAYLASQELFIDTKMKDPEIKELSKTIVSYLESEGLVHKSVNKPNAVDFIVEAMKNVIAIEPYLQECISQHVGRKTMSSAITIPTTNILRILEVLEFFVSYSRILINYITHRELAMVEDSRQKTMSVGPNDHKYINERLTTFTVACRVMATPLPNLKADMGAMPNMVVTEETVSEITATFGKNVVDPNGFSSVPFPLSLVFHFRMGLANWQMDNYDSSKATAKAVNYRVLMYKKRMAEGTGDAAIEDLLDIQEKRLLDIQRDLERTEVKYGLK